MTTESRKKDHVELVVKKGAQYEKTSGFERIDFVHNSLPEINFDEIDLSTQFLGKSLRYPVLITAMTGGYKDAKKINRDLASACQKHGLAFGLGSQRAMIENPGLKETYSVRDVAPDIPLIANIGAYQLKKYDFDQIESLVSSVEADALAVHLNPLQEIIQKEGDRDFSGILDAIRSTVEKLDVPIIAKETGAGISQDVALKLQDAGVEYIDVSGSGGTSWSKVEYLRQMSTPGFENWGIPTVTSLIECRNTVPLIATGGIRDGISGAKAIALGASIVGAGYPFLVALRNGELESFIEEFTSQMKITAFLTGSKTLDDLKHAKTIFY